MGSNKKRGKASPRLPKSGKNTPAGKDANIFDIKEHNKLNSFQKLAYIAQKINFPAERIANIVGVNPDVMTTIFDTGYIPSETPNAGKI